MSNGQNCIYEPDNPSLRIPFNPRLIPFEGVLSRAQMKNFVVRFNSLGLRICKQYRLSRVPTICEPSCLFVATTISAVIQFPTIPAKKTQLHSPSPNETLAHMNRTYCWAPNGSFQTLTIVLTSLEFQRLF